MVIPIRYYVIQKEQTKPLKPFHLKLLAIIKAYDIQRIRVLIRARGAKGSHLHISFLDNSGRNVAGTNY
jgi:hypothetical protein